MQLVNVTLLSQNNFMFRSLCEVKHSETKQITKTLLIAYTKEGNTATYFIPQYSSWEKGQIEYMNK